MSAPERADHHPQPILPDWEVTCREVKRLREAREDFLLLDCRQPEEFELARIEGAQLVPMQDLDIHLERLREHEDSPIVVYCHHGRRSLRVTAALRAAGFVNVKSMAGGIERWSIEIDPTVPQY